MQEEAQYKDAPRYSGYTTSHYAQFIYPLLKHNGNAESFKTYKRNIQDLEDQKLGFMEIKEDFLNDRLKDYLAWLLYHRRVVINDDLLLALRGLHAGSETELALLNSVIAQTENDRREAEIQKQSMVERLAVLLDDPNLIMQTPYFDLSKRAKLIEGNARDYLAKNSRALKRIDIDKKLNSLETDYHKNRLLPSLNLVLRAEKLLDKAGTAATTYDDDTTSYQALLEFSYPLGGSVSTKAELAKRALGTRRLQIIYAERMESIAGDLQRLTRLLDFDEQRLLDAIAAARQSTHLEQQKYLQRDASPLQNECSVTPACASSIRDLVQAYRDERGAKLLHIENLVAYQMRSIEYDNLLDRVLER